MSNWSDWLDWGGRPAPVQSLNNLAGPTNPNVPYQWMRPTNPAWYPSPQGLKVPMFGPGNTQIYPMFGEGALPTQPLPAAATPVTQAPWAQRAGAVGYPTAPQGASVPMFGPDGSPRYPMFGNAQPMGATAPAAAPAPTAPGAKPPRPYGPGTRPSSPAAVPAPAAPGGNLYARRMAAAGGAPPPRPAAAPGSAPLPTRTPGTPGPTYGNVNMGGPAGGGAAGAAPGAAPAPTPGRWNAFRTSTLGPSFLRQPDGGMFTKNLTGARGVGAGLGTALALQALPGFVGQGYTGITGMAPSQQGMETAQSSAGAAGLGLMFGAPVAAAAGLGTFVGDAVGSSGGLGVANTLRGWMGMDPTDDTIGDILGRTPIGGWFGAGGGEQPDANPVAALPASPESIATVGQMAGLDASSTSFLQQQYANSVALSTAQYMADPETFQTQFEAQYGRPMESEADIAQVVFSRIVSEGLPAALESQGAQQAALQNAAMYQDFIGRYMAPIRDQYTDLANRATAAGYGDLALQFQGQGASQESAMRAIPNLEALKAQQAQVNQLAQGQWQSMMGGVSGGGATDPLGDASTLAALGVPTG